MRVASCPLLLALFASSSASALAGKRGLMQGEVVIADDGTPVRPAEVTHSHAAEDWTYVPNNDYKCESVGCCGLATDKNPGLQPCGPANWKYLNADTFERCVSNGWNNQQSPIRFMTEGPNKMNFQDMNSKISAELAHPVFSSHKCKGKIEFKENTWEVDFDNCTEPAHVHILGDRWELVQFHFHNAEHSLNGLYMPLEVHMVHKNKNKDLLVLGVWMVPGDVNLFFKSLEVASRDGTTTDPLNAYDIIPPSRRYWHYEGSLTTPPCQARAGGKVQWFVFPDLVELSVEQLAYFGVYFAQIDKAYNGEVNRPLQPVANCTTIFEHKAEPTIDTAPEVDPDESSKPSKRSLLRL